MSTLKPLFLLALQAIRAFRLSNVVLALSLGLLTAPMFAQPPVVWEPTEVTQTIGGGDLALPVEVKFRVSSPLNNVRVFTAPEIQRFLIVQPSEFASLQVGTDYSLRLSFAVPPRAAQGLYEGTIHLRLGSQTVPQMLKVRIIVNYRGNIPSAAAVSLSWDSLQFCTGVAPGGAGIYFSQTTPELSTIRSGSILVLPPAPQLPYGFLGKVTNVTRLGSALFIATTEASLSDAFFKASVDVNRRLTQQDLASSTSTAAGVSFARRLSPLAVSPAAAGDGLTVRLDDLVLYDRDGNPQTTQDQVLLDGSVSVDPLLQFSFAVDNSRLTQLAFVFKLTESAELTLKYRLQVPFLEREKEFSRHQWSPLVVWVGWLPVVIVPEASLVAGVRGFTNAGIEAGVNQTSILTMGLGYANSSWQPIADFSSSFSINAPSYSAGANVKGYAGPRFKLLLYGFVGPRADLNAFGELDIDIFGTPIWQVFGGLEANAGVLIQIFDRTLANYEYPFLIQYRRLLAEGGIGAQGRIVGSVRDAITRQVIPNAVVAVYRDGSLIDSILTDASGQFSIGALVGAVYRLEVSRAGYLPVTYNDITILPNETKTLDVILQIDTAHAGLGNVSGTVFNAISGAGVPGLTVRLRQGLNTTSGSVVATTTTGPGGAYSFSGLPAGNYTAEASGTGFTNSYFPVLCIGNTTIGNQNGVITPIIPPDQVRIILTWGVSPSDLDSHFTGPLPDGSRFHMYYPYADGNLGSPWPTIVRLDHDDVTSYGPETTTLLQQMAGVYRFSVHDYSNRNATYSTALSESQAQVRIYRGSNLVASFNVPVGLPGTLWTVFEMEGFTIRPINAMSYTSSPVSIMSLIADVPEYDRPLLLNLPVKQP